MSCLPSSIVLAARLQELQQAELQLAALEHVQELAQAQEGAALVAQQLDQQQLVQELQLHQAAAEQEQVR